MAHCRNLEQAGIPTLKSHPHQAGAVTMLLHVQPRASC